MSKSYVYPAFMIPLLALLAARLIGGFDGLYGQDPYEYLRYSQALKTFFISGTSPGDYFWPVGYPLAGALLSFIIPDIAFCLQLISTLSLSFVFIYSIKIIQLLFSNTEKTVPLYTGLFIMLSPYMLRFGLSVMADMFTLATLMMGSYYLFLFIKKQTILHLCMGTFLYSISLMSRYAAIVVFLPVVLLVGYSFLKQRQKWYLLPLILLAGLLPLIPHLLIRAENSGDFIFHDWITQWSPLHFFQKNFTTRDGIYTYSTSNILYVFMGLFHPRYFIAGALIAIIGIRKFNWTLEIKTMAAGVLVYLFFLAGIPFQNNRFLLLVLPFLLIILHPSTLYTLDLLGKKWRLLTGSCILMGQLVFFLFSFKKIGDRVVLEKEIYHYIVENNTRAIYTMDMDISLKGRGYKAPIYNIYTHYYNKVDTTAMVIFNTQVFPKQWVGKTPMDNWEHFNKDYHLKEVKSFKEGWKAYVFE